MLPTEVQNLINAYLNLEINGKTVRTPYYRNVKRVRAELRSLVGKGTPSEIIEETKIYAKLRGFKFRKASEQDIRKFMMSQGLGIDCSGLVAHLYDHWLMSINKGTLYQSLNFSQRRSLYKRFVTWLRPIEHMGANLLSSKQNSDPVDLCDICPGDMIRLKGLRGGHHLALVTEVTYDDEQKPVSFRYVQSTPYYGDQNGVRISEVKVVDCDKSLRVQEWCDPDEGDTCPAYKQLLKDFEDNGSRRPKFLADEITQLKSRQVSD
ncbi:hypothetical protein GF357_02595 [Candidatus Dojkabacteria bacterium]|nr:hypothetical protein [Candidatus Dojkabacteria bacterium]